MRCDLAQRELSARLDGEGEPAVRERVADHLEGCPRCRSYDQGARRVRRLVRLEPAAPVPDLVPSILDSVRARPPRARRLRRGWARDAVAFAAAALVAVLVLSGLPGLRRGPLPVSASEIPARVAAAISQVTAYRATFDIVERHFAPRVPERRFVARIGFRAPETFRARVQDETDYPGSGWPRNDLTLSIDPERWRVTGPASCPREALPGCATGLREVRSVEGREPFDGDASLPTDVILPVTTLADAGRLQVLGDEMVGDRDAVVVEIAFRDAGPLFAYLHAAGSWRPFFQSDRVEVALDPETWFPLAYRVSVAPGTERRAWAVRNGLPPEQPGEIVFAARARWLGTEVPNLATSRPPPSSVTADHGFRDVPWRSLEKVAGHRPVEPGVLHGLRPYRAGVFEGGARAPGEVLTSYVRGLAWLKIRETRRWDQPAPFGDVDPSAAPVQLPGGGVGYHEPPGGGRPRRLAVHASETDLVLETNLRLDDLLAVAGSLPIRGRRIPSSWRIRHLPGGTLRMGVSVGRAVRTAPFLLLPGWLPPEYRPDGAEVFTGRGGPAVTVRFLRPAGEPDGEGIRLFQDRGAALPPPTDPGALSIRLRGTLARYSSFRGELEWVEGGVYRSLRSASLGLDVLVDVAESLSPPGSGAP